MLTYIVRRVALAIPTLVGITLLVSAMLALTPGDPAQMLAGPDAPREVVERLRAELALDEPFLVQYGRFMTRAVQGDLGQSVRTGRPVIEEVGRRLLATLELSGAALLIAIVLGIPLGTLSAVRPNTPLDYASMFTALLGVSIPVFWLGMLLMLLFAVQLGWLPAAGRGTIAHLILPATTLSAPTLAVIARFTRSSLLEILGADYIRTAKAKGLPERIVVLVHAMRNALIPILTIIGVRIGILIGGSVLTETVFAWPGVGRLLVDSVRARDLPTVRGLVLILALILVVVNLLTDLVYGVINPKVRYE